MSEEFLYPEFETKWSNSEIIDMLFDWAKFCMKNKTGDLSNDTAGYFSDKLKAKIAACSPSTPPTTEEAELWKEIGSKFLENLAEVQFHTEQKNPEARKATIANFLNALQERYHLCLRSEQKSEAIEFAEWMRNEEVELCEDKWRRISSSQLYTTAQLYQEFQLFKQKR